MNKKPTQEEKTALSTIHNYIYGNWLTMVIYTFAELGIADILEDKNASAEEISLLTQTNPEALIRFLRCACDLQLTEFHPDTNSFSLSWLGQFLRTNHPYSKRNLARLNGSYFRYNPWGNLVQILRDGNSKKWSPTYEKGTLDYLSDKPQYLKMFQQAMNNASEEENLPIASSYDFSSYNHIVDVGGGTGNFLKTILRINPQLNGTIYDLKMTLELAEYDNKTDINKRMKREEGDFFEFVPDTGDIYLLKNVIHNWPEEKALLLLENISLAMKSVKSNQTAVKDKKLLIIENIIEDKNGVNAANWLDLNFMILVDGKERSLLEYHELAAHKGFMINRIIPTPTSRKILELSII
jgi:hypothetical protein